MLILIKLIVGSLWLVAAFWCKDKIGGRYIFSFTASILSLVYLGALTGGLLLKEETGNWGAALAGFLVGCGLGICLGGLFGILAVKNIWIYWLIQLSAVCIFVFLPPLF